MGTKRRKKNERRLATRLGRLLITTTSSCFTFCVSIFSSLLLLYFSIASLFCHAIPFFWDWCVSSASAQTAHEQSSRSLKVIYLFFVHGKDFFGWRHAKHICLNTDKKEMESSHIRHWSTSGKCVFFEVSNWTDRWTLFSCDFAVSHSQLYLSSHNTRSAYNDKHDKWK